MSDIVRPPASLCSQSFNVTYLHCMTVTVHLKHRWDHSNLKCSFQPSMVLNQLCYKFSLTQNKIFWLLPDLEECFSQTISWPVATMILHSHSYNFCTYLLMTKEILPNNTILTFIFTNCFVSYLQIFWWNMFQMRKKNTGWCSLVVTDVPTDHPSCPHIPKLSIKQMSANLR